MARVKSKAEITRSVTMRKHLNYGSLLVLDVAAEVYSIRCSEEETVAFQETISTRKKPSWHSANHI